jgi:hypothetical protein
MYSLESMEQQVGALAKANRELLPIARFGANDDEFAYKSSNY